MAIAEVVAGNGGRIPGEILRQIERCPHCGVSAPNMNRVWADKWKDIGLSGWAAYRCNNCEGVVVCEVEWRHPDYMDIDQMWPSSKVAHEDIPEPARTFLAQAYETLHAPDAAAVMAGSAVDGMLKAMKYKDGSLYERIDQALKDGVLTQGMAEWAHSVRLGSNRPRHSDENRPHVSPEQAKQSVEFAEALGSFLFVLTARIRRGIKAAGQAQSSAGSP